MYFCIVGYLSLRKSIILVPAKDSFKVVFYACNHYYRRLLCYQSIKYLGYLQHHKKKECSTMLSFKCLQCKRLRWLSQYYLCQDSRVSVHNGKNWNSYNLHKIFTHNQSMPRRSLTDKTLPSGIASPFNLTYLILVKKIISTGFLASPRDFDNKEQLELHMSVSLLKILSFAVTWQNIPIIKKLRWWNIYIEKREHLGMYPCN